MFGFIKNFKTQKPISEGDIFYDNNKKFADKYAEALIKIRNEKDLIKREKMNSRLALGITDFSDL